MNPLLHRVRISFISSDFRSPRFRHSTVQSSFNGLYLCKSTRRLHKMSYSAFTRAYFFSIYLKFDFSFPAIYRNWIALVLSIQFFSEAIRILAGTGYFPAYQMQFCRMSEKVEKTPVQSLLREMKAQKIIWRDKNAEIQLRAWFETRIRILCIGLE